MNRRVYKTPKLTTNTANEKNKYSGKSQRAEKVYEFFTFVAPIYDRVHDVLFLGIHRMWRNRLIMLLNPGENTKLVDMAGGTGDIAFRFMDHVEKHNIKGCDVTVCDINQPMLDAGKARKQASKHYDAIKWVKDDAECLSFPAEVFTAYTIAFGIRNCTYPNQVLNEAFRILQPGGKFLCLEAFRAEGAIFRWLHDFYYTKLYPVLECITTWKKPKFTTFLIETLEDLPSKESFKAMMEEAGFTNVTYESMFFGLMSIHKGIKK